MSNFTQVISDIDVPRGYAPSAPESSQPQPAQKGLSMGKQNMQLVFSPDLRRLVTNTTDFPFRAIAHLLVDVGGPTPEYATGWFLSPNVVITAAHALSYVDASGNDVMASRVRVIPGRNGVGAPPFGVFDSTTMRVSQSWLPNRDAATDYGAVHLDQSVGDTVGWFGCGIFTDGQIASSQFNVVGYPNDKQPLGSMWGETGPAVPEPDQLAYRMSSYPGQSGCPVYAIISGSPWVAGIHSGGQGSANFAVRITQAVFNELTSWKN